MLMVKGMRSNTKAQGLALDRRDTQASKMYEGKRGMVDIAILK